MVPVALLTPPTQAHRLAAIFAHGALIFPAKPGVFVVCHRCDFKPCCNPQHLFLGTQGDNIREARNKGYFLVQRRQRYVTLPDGIRLYPFERLPVQLSPGWGDYLARQRRLAKTFPAVLETSTDYLLGRIETPLPLPTQEGSSCS